MRLSIVTVVLVLSIFFGCESPTGPGTNSTSVNTDEIPAEYMFNDSLAIDTVPYQLVGTSYSDYGRRFRIASFKEREIREVSRDCRDDTLVVQYDTTDSRTDTTSVFIRQDTLFYVHHLPQGSNKFTRLSGTTGLAGWWKSTYEEAPDFGDNEDNWLVRVTYKMIEYVHIDQGRITIYSRMYKSPPVWANMFIRSWNCGNPYLCIPFMSDSAKYDIEVEKLNFLTVRLRGNVTGEIVTVEWVEKKDNQYEIVTTSTNSEHPTHTYKTYVETCPRGSNEPKWWDEFLEANKRQ